MRLPIVVALFASGMFGCSSDVPTGTPSKGTGSTPEAARGWYVSPDGSVVGDGTKAAPWALSTALAQPGVVQPGDTIWLLGGTYRGDFRSVLTGAPGSPVVLRQAPGERATIDGRLEINGRYAYYSNFEVTYSDLRRVTAQPGSDPTDLPRERKTIFVTGPFNKLINLVVHDLGDGVFSGFSAEGLEIYGCVVYNNGWLGPDRGHGHSLYLQNRGTTKRVVDNVIFNSFSTGLKIGGSDASSLSNIHVEGNSVFGSGAPARLQFGYDWNLHVQGGGTTLRDIVVVGNSLFHDQQGGPLQVGQFGDTPQGGLQFRNNIVQGGQSEFNFWPDMIMRGNKFTTGSVPLAGGRRILLIRRPVGVAFSNYRIESNAYSTPPSAFAPLSQGDTTAASLAAWQAMTGWDLQGSLIRTEFPGTDVVVRPNQYEAGRATVTVWNWSAQATATVALPGVLKAGDSYQIHHVYDVFGPPIRRGTYDGRGVTLDLKEYPAPLPTGSSSAIPSTGARFNVFLVRKGA